MPTTDLNIIIWNAKISSARSGVDLKSWRLSKRFIASLIFQEIDFIGLIEIDEKSVAYLNTIFARFHLPYKVADGTQKRGNTRFDTCIIYRANKFGLIQTPLLAKVLNAPVISKTEISAVPSAVAG